MAVCHTSARLGLVPGRPVAPSSQPADRVGKARAVNAGAVVTRAGGRCGDRVTDGTGGELVAAAEHAVTPSRMPAATGIAGKRAECHMLAAQHRVEVPSL